MDKASFTQALNLTQQQQWQTASFYNPDIYPGNILFQSGSIWVGGADFTPPTKPITPRPPVPVLSELSQALSKSGAERILEFV